MFYIIFIIINWHFLAYVNLIYVNFCKLSCYPFYLCCQVLCIFLKSDFSSLSTNFLLTKNFFMFTSITGSSCYLIPFNFICTYLIYNLHSFLSKVSCVLLNYFWILFQEIDKLFSVTVLSASLLEIKPQ